MLKSFLFLLFFFTALVITVSAAEPTQEQSTKVNYAREISDSLEISKRIQSAIKESRASLAKVAPGKTPRIAELNKKVSEISVKQFDLEAPTLVKEVNDQITRDLIAMFSEVELKYWANILKLQAGQKFVKFIESDNFRKTVNLPYGIMQKVSSDAYRAAAKADAQKPGSATKEPKQKK